MYWLNPQLMEKENTSVNYSNQGFTSPTSTISSITMDSLASTRTRKWKITSKHHNYVTDNSLAEGGTYQKRLHDPLLHFPTDCPELILAKKEHKKTPHVKCNLHCWFGGKSRIKIVYCNHQINKSK